MLQQAERELTQKQLELDRLAQEMGEQGSRGIVAGHFGRNATTQAASRPSLPILASTCFSIKKQI